MKLVQIRERKAARAGFSLAEVVIATFVLGVVILALFAAFSAGFSIVQTERENLRATQIMLQKMETVRLLTWPQGVNTTVAPTNFTEYYDPLASTKGASYAGSYSTPPASASIPADYRNALREAKVTISWTNYIGKKPIVHKRQVQTFVARYGMQNYVF